MRQHFIKQLMPEKSRRTDGASERVDAEGPHTKWEESRWCWWSDACHFGEVFESLEVIWSLRRSGADVSFMYSVYTVLEELSRGYMG